MNENTKIIKYNIHNIVTIVLFGFYILLSFTLFKDLTEWLINNLYIYGIIVLLWPLLVCSYAIKLNKKKMRRYIDKQNKQRYLAHGMYIDEKSDNGSLTEAMWYALANSNVKKKRTIKSADLLYWGMLEDLNVLYEIHKFEYIVKAGVRKGIKLRGDAILFEFETNIFPEKWSLFINPKVNVNKLSIRQPLVKELVVDNQPCLLGLYNEATNSQINAIQTFVQSDPSYLLGDERVMVVFKNNRCVIYRENKNGFNYKIPFLLNSLTFRKIVNKQKFNILSFNKTLLNFNQMMVNDISND